MSLTRQQRAEQRKKALAHLKKMEYSSAHVPIDPKARTEDIEVISTGSIVLDKVLGCGGLPRGRITEIFGPEAVGKTTLGIACCIEAQRAGGFATYIDFEHAIHLGYAKAMGLDLREEAFAFFQPDYFEMGAQVAYDYTKLVQSDIIVIDSVTAMLPRKVFEAGPQDPAKAMGLQARLMSSFLNLISKEIPASRTVLVFINQMRSNIKLSKYDAGPDWTTSGGKALPYYATIRLRLKPGKTEYANILNPATGEREKLPISNFVKVEGFKNKVGFPKRKGEFVIRYGEGIDNARSIIQVAVNHKIIKKGGAWYTYKKEGEPGYFNQQGVEATRRFLLKNMDVFKMLMDDVSEKLATFEVTQITQNLSDDDLTVEDAPQGFSDDTPIELDDSDEDISALLEEDEETPAPKNIASSDKLLSLEDIDAAIV